MKAKRGLPQGVRLTEGLGSTEKRPHHGALAQDHCGKGGVLRKWLLALIEGRTKEVCVLVRLTGSADFQARPEPANQESHPAALIFASLTRTVRSGPRGQGRERQYVKPSIVSCSIDRVASNQPSLRHVAPHERRRDLEAGVRAARESCCDEVVPATENWTQIHTGAAAARGQRSAKQEREVWKRPGHAWQ